MVCMSSDSTLRLINSLGHDHDKLVLEWKDQMHHRLEQTISEVSGISCNAYAVDNYVCQF